MNIFETELIDKGLKYDRTIGLPRMNPASDNDNLSVFMNIPAIILAIILQIVLPPNNQHRNLNPSQALPQLHPLAIALPCLYPFHMGHQITVPVRYTIRKTDLFTRTDLNLEGQLVKGAGVYPLVYETITQLFQAYLTVVDSVPLSPGLGRASLGALLVGFAGCRVGLGSQNVWFEVLTEIAKGLPFSIMSWIWLCCRCSVLVSSFTWTLWKGRS